MNTFYAILGILCAGICLGLFPILRERKERIVLSPTPIMAIDTNKGHLIKGDVAYIDGRDPDAQPPLTVMNVRIWDSAARAQSLCTLRHGTEVDILDIQHHAPEGRYYLHILGGDCQGWISEPFLSDRQWAPIGDQL